MSGRGVRLTLPGVYICTRITPQCSVSMGLHNWNLCTYILYTCRQTCCVGGCFTQFYLTR